MVMPPVVMPGARPARRRNDLDVLLRERVGVQPGLELREGQLRTSSNEMVLRSPVALSEWPRKSFVTAAQSKVRFDIDFTVTGGSVIVLENV